MKRSMFLATLTGMVAAILLAVLPCEAVAAPKDGPLPSDPPAHYKPLPKKPVVYAPVCIPLKAVATKTGVASVGTCKDRKGNKVWGAQWLYKDLTITGSSNTACPIPEAKTSGSAGKTGVIPLNFKGVAVTVRWAATIWVPKTSKHLASVRSDPRSTKFLTVDMPGTPVICPGQPDVVNNNPDSSIGSGNGGDTRFGFVCGWAGTKQLTFDKSGVHIPAIDCSGNGSCHWVPDKGSYPKFGYIFYTGSVTCTSGIFGIPSFIGKVTNLDGSTCFRNIGGVDTYPLPSSWSGDITITAVIVSTSRGRDASTVNNPKLTLGPIHGSGTNSLCSSDI